MLNILTREEFIENCNSRIKFHMLDCSEKDHPLWIPESNLPEGKHCEWFICVKPLNTSSPTGYYWDWCDSTLSGQTACFISDRASNTEWWGFTDKESALIWALKWA